MSRGSIYQYGNAGFTVSPQGQYNPAPVSGQGNTQVSYSPSTAQNYSTSGYGSYNPIGGTPTQTAGGMLSAGSNYTGYSGGSAGDLGGQATSLYSADVPTSALGPEQISNQMVPEEIVSLETQFATDPFQFDETTGQDYDTALQDWELQKDYNEGALAAEQATLAIGGTPESNAQMLLARGQFDRPPEEQYELAKSMSAYLGGEQQSILSSQLLSAGYTPEELKDLGIGQQANPDDYIDETGTFNYGAWFKDYNETSDAQDKNYFELFDNKVLETKANQAETWDELRSTSPQDFATEYGSASVSDKNSYLYNQFKSGDLDQDSYRQQVIGNLAQEGKKVVQVEDKYYYYEPKEGSSATSSKIDGSEQYFEVNFTPEKFDTNAVARLSEAGQGMMGLRTDNIDDKVIVGTDALGQLLYKETPAGNVELTEEEKKKHQEANFLSYGIGSRGKAVNPFKDKLRDEFLAIARVGAAIATGGASELGYTAYRGATGETLKGEDYANLAIGGLKLSGALVPPNPAAGNVGKGLGSLSYGQTTGLINTVATGDPVGLIVNEVVVPYVGEAINNALPQGASKEWKEQWDKIPSDVRAGLSKTASKMLEGDSFEDAAPKGVLAWAEQSGIDDKLEDVLKQAGSTFDDEVLQKIKNAVNTTIGSGVVDKVGDVLSSADTAVRQGLSEFDKEVLQPVTKPVADALSAADTAVRQALPSFGSLGIDLPNISLGMLTGGSTLSPTRTTDDVFKEDLFKLKTKIGISPVEELLRSPQQQRQQEVAGLYEDPFASSFDQRNTF